MWWSTSHSPIDKRHISVGVFTPRGSNIFGLHFASEEQRKRFYELAVQEGFENESVCVVARLTTAASSVR